MRGIVFTELLEMVEEKYDASMVDDVLDACNLSTDGAYTSVGTYDHTEFLQIVRSLSAHTNTSVSDLIQIYGEHLFGRFHHMMPVFFEEPKTAFEFLESVHDTIHVEVNKLYPNAKLPEFQTRYDEADRFIMTYKSRCPFADFALGLIKGCIKFYQEKIEIAYEDANTDEHFVRVFTLSKVV